MPNIIEELWYGRLKPFEKCISASDDARELDDYIARHKRVLSEIMTAEQRWRDSRGRRLHRAVEDASSYVASLNHFVGDSILT